MFSVLLPYLHAEKGTPAEDMQVVLIQADIVVTLAAREDIVEVITGDKHGRVTSGTTDSGHFMNQRRCPSIDKTLADCPEFDEKQWQEIPAEKPANRFESRFD